MVGCRLDESPAADKYFPGSGMTLPWIRAFSSSKSTTMEPEQREDACLQGMTPMAYNGSQKLKKSFSEDLPVLQRYPGTGYRSQVPWYPGIPIQVGIPFWVQQFFQLQVLVVLLLARCSWRVVRMTLPVLVSPGYRFRVPLITTR